MTDESSGGLPVMLALRRLRPVGWPLRAIAALIDALIFIPAYLLVPLAVGSSLGESPLPAALAAVAIPFLYWTLAEGFTGRTLGKAIVGIRVVGQDGLPPGWRAVLVRNVFKYGTHLVPFAEAVTLLAILWSPQRQRIGDMVAHTVVVRPDEGAPIDSDPRGDRLELHR
jgi:uncharacterized RDD family membrane protein YckC